MGIITAMISTTIVITAKTNTTERPCGWQKSSEVCSFLLKKTTDHKDVDSRRPLTENVVFSFGTESRFYAVLSKVASSGLATASIG
jgi:hypothetical protein